MLTRQNWEKEQDRTRNVTLIQFLEQAPYFCCDAYDVPGHESNRAHLALSQPSQQVGAKSLRHFNLATYTISQFPE